jgi:hypothetical protein
MGPKSQAVGRSNVWKPIRRSVKKQVAETEAEASSEPLDIEAEPGEYFEMDFICDKKLQDGLALYRVRWKGFSEADDTWEPREHFAEPAVVEDYDKLLAQRKSAETAAAKTTTDHPQLAPRIGAQPRIVLVQTSLRGDDSALPSAATSTPEAASPTSSVPERTALGPSQARMKRTALVLGWWGAQPRAVNHFVALYERLGYVVIVYTAPSSVCFGGIWSQRKAARLLLRKMGSADETDELVVHALSNNGAQMWLALVHEDQTGWFMPSRLKGVVLDSCPGSLSLSTAVGAFLANKPSTPKRIAFYGLPAFLLAILLHRRRRNPLRLVAGLFFTAVAYLSLERSNNRTYHSSFTRTPSVPHLFVYGPNDALCTQKVISSVVAKMRDQTTARIHERLFDSPHVGHLRANPMEYEASIRQFLQSPS